MFLGGMLGMLGIERGVPTNDEENGRFDVDERGACSCSWSFSLGYEMAVGLAGMLDDRTISKSRLRCCW